MSIWTDNIFVECAKSFCWANDMKLKVIIFITWVNACLDNSLLLSNKTMQSRGWDDYANLILVTVIINMEGFCWGTITTHLCILRNIFVIFCCKEDIVFSFSRIKVHWEEYMMRRTISVWSLYIIYSGQIEIFFLVYKSIYGLLNKKVSIRR